MGKINRLFITFLLLVGVRAFPARNEDLFDLLENGSPAMASSDRLERIDNLLRFASAQKTAELVNRVEDEMINFDEDENETELFRKKRSYNFENNFSDTQNGFFPSGDDRIVRQIRGIRSRRAQSRYMCYMYRRHSISGC